MGNILCNYKYTMALVLLFLFINCTAVESQETQIPEISVQSEMKDVSSEVKSDLPKGWEEKVEIPPGAVPLEEVKPPYSVLPGKRLLLTPDPTVNPKPAKKVRKIKPKNP